MSFIFDIGSGDKKWDKYAKQTTEAIKEITAMMPSLSLHNRVAILLPDSSFRDDLRKAMSESLGVGLPHRRFELVDACTLSHDTAAQADKEFLIFDELKHFDGLEKLIVVAVGLDRQIEGGSSGTTVLKARSLLYRAITRAHMIVAVVNERVSNSFLTYLMSLELEKDRSFDARA